MSKLINSLILSSAVLSFPLLAFNCKEMTEQPFYKQKQLFVEARDKFIAEMQFDKYEAVITKALKNSDASGTKNALWIEDIPSEIIDYKNELLTPDEGWEKRLKFWNKSVIQLEQMAKCYHNGYTTSDKPLMMLKLYEEEESKQMYIGYHTTVSKDSGASSVRFTTPSKCHEKKCEFENAPLNSFYQQQHTMIRLVHTPSAVEEITHDYTDQNDGLLLESSLVGIDLKTTGEMFTSPEIMIAVTYLDNELDNTSKTVKVVGIPWALKKGNNAGRTRLIDWTKSSKVNLIVYEDDLDIPYGKIAKLISTFFESVIKQISPASSFRDSIHSVIESNANGKDNDLTDYISAFSQDDILDRIVIDRQSSETYVTGVKSKVSLHLDHRHSKMKKDEL